jgi:hypothetical protein
MFTRPDILVESQTRTKLSHWRGFLLIAAAWFTFTPVVLWSLNQHLRLEPSTEITLATWAIVSGIGTFCIWTTIQTTYFAVTPNLLQVGRSPRETIVEFSEIESIVISLPAQQSWLLRAGQISHYNHLSYRMMAEKRKASVLLRLRGGKYLALHVSPFLVTNAESVQSALLSLNRSKILGADSYTPEEVRSLGNIYFNMVRTM